MMMTFEENFSSLKELFMQADVSKLNGDFAIQFNLTGEGEGTFYAEYKGGKLSVEPYDYHDRDCAITCSYDLLNKIINGKQDAIQAFFTGKLKVDGNVDKALALKALAKSDK